MIKKFKETATINISRNQTKVTKRKDHTTDEWET